MNRLKKIGDLDQRTNVISTSLRHIHLTTQEINQEFEFQTKLNYKDFAFMLIIASIHLAKQYIICEKTERKDHNLSDQDAHRFQDIIFKTPLITQTKPRYYYASRAEICNSYSVPYDITIGTQKYDLGGVGKGLGGGLHHRHYTLGHDPLLGLYFGTANILTNTCTTISLSTVHVKNGVAVNRAQTHLMLDYFHDRIKHDPTDAALALIKQALHIWSDTFSKKGLELPLLAQTLNYENAAKLTQYGIDFGNTIKLCTQNIVSKEINYISSIILCLLYNATPENHILVEAKIKKIITGANILATSSNILNVILTQSLAHFDFGGMISTLKQTCINQNRIAELQCEFLINEWTKKLS